MSLSKLSNLRGTNMIRKNNIVFNLRVWRETLLGFNRRDPNFTIKYPSSAPYRAQSLFKCESGVLNVKNTKMMVKINLSACEGSTNRFSETSEFVQILANACMKVHNYQEDLCNTESSRRLFLTVFVSIKKWSHSCKMTRAGNTKIKIVVDFKYCGRFESAFRFCINWNK